MACFSVLVTDTLSVTLSVADGGIRDERGSVLREL